MAIIELRSRSRAEAAAAARRRRRPAPAPPPPPRRRPAAAGAAACAGRAEDHAGVEGAVRLRQGRAEARRQGGDRQRDHREAAGRAEARARAGHRPHRPRSVRRQYNQKLSERRADAVRDYLVSKGVPTDKIETLGMGKTQPVPGVVCKQKNMKELIACLAPNRRVEVEVKGEGDRDARSLRSVSRKSPASRGAFFCAARQASAGAGPQESLRIAGQRQPDASPLDRDDG